MLRPRSKVIFSYSKFPEKRRFPFSERTLRPPTRYRGRSSTKRLRVKTVIKLNYSAGGGAAGSDLFSFFIVMAVSFTGSGLRVMDTGSFNPLPTLQMTYLDFISRQVDYFSRCSVNCIQTRDSLARGSVNDEWCDPFHQR